MIHLRVPPGEKVAFESARQVEPGEWAWRDRTSDSARRTIRFFSRIHWFIWAYAVAMGASAAISERWFFIVLGGAFVIRFREFFLRLIGIAVVVMPLLGILFFGGTLAMLNTSLVALTLGETLGVIGVLIVAGLIFGGAANALFEESPKHVWRPGANPPKRKADRHHEIPH